MGSGVQAGDETLGGGLFIASCAVDLAGEVKPRRSAQLECRMQAAGTT